MSQGTVVSLEQSTTQTAPVAATQPAPVATAPAQHPASYADLAAGIPNVVAANPLTRWTEGQYVQTRTLGEGGRGWWDGNGWKQGTAPAPPATGATEGTPGTWSPAGSDPPSARRSDCQPHLCWFCSSCRPVTISATRLPHAGLRCKRC
jgi:hypothetical protein